jgi:hypothetical protein
MTDIEALSTEDAAESAPAAPARRAWRPRWVPLVVADLTLLLAGFVLISGWGPIRASHPALLLTLIALVVGSLALSAWAILTTPPQRSAAFRWLTRVTLVIGAIAVWIVVVFLRPLGAEPVAIDALVSGDVDDGVTVTVTVTATSIVLQPDAAQARATGLVFYPGGLVDPRAYTALLRPIAEAGFPVRIAKFPYNLAVLGSGAADRWIGDEGDDVERWVLGGHSLGGAMAARWAEADRDELAGLLLWAAFPVNPMADRTGLAVASIYGTNDTVARPGAFERSRDELPSDTNFVPIDGAIHSFFGDYGLQDGDGTPGISRADAQALIVEASLDLLIAVDART